MSGRSSSAAARLNTRTGPHYGRKRESLAGARREESAACPTTNTHRGMVGILAPGLRGNGEVTKLQQVLSGRAAASDDLDRPRGSGDQLADRAAGNPAPVDFGQKAPHRTRVTANPPLTRRLG